MTQETFADFGIDLLSRLDITWRRQSRSSLVAASVDKSKDAKILWDRSTARNYEKGGIFLLTIKGVRNRKVFDAKSYRAQGIISKLG